MRGTPADTSDAGRIRPIQVCIGSNIENARFVPPPPGDQLQAGVEEWEKWIELDSGLPSVARVALAHYQFEALHPFNDGNGRLGRLVCVLQLARAGDLRVPVLNISPWFERNKRAYQDHLLTCSVNGDFDPWIRFFCKALKDQAMEALERIDALLDWKDSILRRLAGHKIRGVAVTIAEELIGYPMITPALAARTYDVSYPAANTAIAKLEDLGILHERTGRRYGRLFQAPEVLRIIN